MSLKGIKKFDGTAEYIYADDTLSEENAPGEAKAAGDRIAGVEGRITTLETAAPEIISNATKDWLDDNVTPTGSAVAIDSSLTQSGLAADAKAAGDAVNDLKSDLVELPVVNLFDASAITRGSFITSSGAMQTGQNWTISDYMPFYMDRLMTVSGLNTLTTNSYGAFYDEQNNYLAPLRPANGVISSYPNNAAKIRMSIHVDDVATFSYTTKKVEPYNGSYYSTPAEKMQGITVDSYYDDSENLTSGYWDYQSKQVVSSSGYKHLNLIPVHKGDIVKLTEVQGPIYAIYTEEETVAQYYYSGSRKYSNYVFEVLYDGDLAVNVANANASAFSLFINGYRVVYSGDLDWFDISILSGVTWSTWVGKAGVMFGDSIVAGHSDDSTEGGAYARRLKDHLSLSSCVNHGASGKPIADGTSAGNGTVSSVTNISNYDSFDLVVVAGGTNDFKLNVPLGTLSDVGGTFDRNTFYGAIQTIIEWIVNKNKKIRLVFWTPLQRNNDGYNTFTTNTVNLKLSDYCEAIKNVCALYGIPVIDMYNISGINLLNLSYYTADGLHLNGVGYDIVSYIGAKQINVL